MEWFWNLKEKVKIKITFANSGFAQWLVYFFSDGNVPN